MKILKIWSLLQKWSGPIWGDLYRVRTPFIIVPGIAYLSRTTKVEIQICERRDHLLTRLLRLGRDRRVALVQHDT
jgi:hypothetical protein